MGVITVFRNGGVGIYYRDAFGRRMMMLTTKTTRTMTTMTMDNDDGDRQQP